MGKPAYPVASGPLHHHPELPHGCTEIAGRRYSHADHEEPPPLSGSPHGGPWSKRLAAFFWSRQRDRRLQRWPGQARPEWRARPLVDDQPSLSPRGAEDAGAVRTRGGGQAPGPATGRGRGRRSSGYGGTAAVATRAPAPRRRPAAGQPRAHTKAAVAAAPEGGSPRQPYGRHGGLQPPARRQTVGGDTNGVGRGGGHQRGYGRSATTTVPDRRRRSRTRQRTEARRHPPGLQLGVVLHRAVVAAGHDHELAACAGAPRQLARVRDRDALVALGVQEQQRHVEPLDRGVERVLGEEALERRHVGAEVEARRCAGRAAGRRRSPGRSPPRPRAQALGGEDRQVAAHARAAQRQRPSPSSAAIVATSSSARPSSAPLAPCPRWSKHTAASPAARAARRSRGGSPCASRRRGGSPPRPADRPRAATARRPARRPRRGSAGGAGVS